MSAGCVNVNAAPAIVTRTLRNTRPYVRLTSVARSVPVRVWTAVGAYEKPMMSFSSVEVLDEIIPQRMGAVPATDVGLVRRWRSASPQSDHPADRPHLDDARRRADLALEVTAATRFLRRRQREIALDRSVHDR